jgi:uncharacterized membrane protein YqhA
MIKKQFLFYQSGKIVILLEVISSVQRTSLSNVIIKKSEALHIYLKGKLLWLVGLYSNYISRSIS